MPLYLYFAPFFDASMMKYHLRNQLNTTELTYCKIKHYLKIKKGLRCFALEKKRLKNKYLLYHNIFENTL